MIILTDSKENKKYLTDIMAAFEPVPEYQLKLVACRSTMTRESIDKTLDQLDAECVILLGSTLLRYYTGLSPSNWEVQPARKEGITVFAVPSLGYVVRRDMDLTMFAKVVSSAMFVEQTGGEGVILCEQVPIIDLHGMEKCAEHIRQTGLMCFDFETFTEGDSKDYEWFREDFHASLLSLCPQPGIAYTLPLTHKENPILPQEMEHIMSVLKDLFGDPDIIKLGQNVKYDMHVAMRIGIDKLEGRYDDSMLMLALLDNTRKNYGLKQVSSEFFPELDGYEAEAGQYKWKDVPLDILGKYAANDTHLTMLFCAMWEQRMDATLTTLYRNLVAPATKTLQKMEYRGMYVNLDVIEEGIEFANKLEKEIEDKLRAIPTVAKFDKIRNDEIIAKRINQEEAKIAAWQEADRSTAHYEEKAQQRIRDIKTGKLIITEPLNFASHKQMKSLIYHQAGFGYNSLEKTTAENVLRDIDDPSGLIDGLLKLRSINKTRSTYLNGIKSRVVNGKLHTTFTQHVTATGRLSSRQPNLQNLPNVYRIHDEDLKKLVGYVKQSFTAPEGYSIIQADLSQAELRMMAEFSQDPTMVNAYKEGKDLHAIAAADQLGITLEEFYELGEEEIKDYRFRAKARNFGLIYLMSIQGYKDYAKNDYGITLTMAEATDHHESFFRLYPGIRRYHKIYEAKAKKFGKVRNWFGRQRWLPNINHENSMLASMDLRAGINTPIQGTAGDYMTLSLVHIDQRLGEDIQLVNSIHDSAIAYIPTDKLPYYIPLVQECMEHPMAEQLFNKKWKTLTMKTDVEVSEKSWADLTEINLEKVV